MARYVALFFVSLSLSAGVAAANVTGGSPQRVAGQRHGGWMAPDANPKHAWMYVTSGRGNAIAIFDLQRIGTPQIGEITNVGPVPNGMALDSQGTLYVANWNGGQNGGNVEVFPAGATSPSLTLTEDLSIPLTVSVDGQANVYVVNRGSAPSIVVFPPGQTTPSQVITSSLIQDPVQIVFDSAQNLYYTDNITGISEIPAGSSQPVSLGLQGLDDPSGLIIDPVNGNFFVSETSNHKVLVYASGAVQPSYALKSSIGACSLGVGTLKGKEYIYVPDCGAGDVAVFKHDARRPLGVLNLPAPGNPPGASCIVFKPEGVP